MSVTFHRAFDRVANYAEALQDIIDIGAERILTSGLQPNVDKGLHTLQHLVALANNRIIIMPGSGVRASNLANIISHTGAIEYHSSARKLVASDMHITTAAMNEHLQHVAIDVTEIQAMRKILDNQYTE